MRAGFGAPGSSDAWAFESKLVTQVIDHDKQYVAPERCYRRRCPGAILRR